MATQLKTPTDVRSQVSEEEWQLRVDLACAYRLVAHYGWDDLIFTHLSVRVPGPEHHFLINPYNLMFDEITASSLVKIDLNGNPHWHKPTDTIENMSAASLQITADLVLTMLPEIERVYVLHKD